MLAGRAATKSGLQSGGLRVQRQLVRSQLSVRSELEVQMEAPQQELEELREKAAGLQALLEDQQEHYEQRCS